MRKKKTTAAELSKELGLSMATVYRLRNAYPDLAPPFSETERWRQFCLEHLVSSEATTRLLVKTVSGPSR
jgi:predicted DNA-binding transcriptional regulator YafY